MTTRRTAQLALALLAFVASSTATLARAESTESSQSKGVLSVGATVLSKCSVDTESTIDVQCENTAPARVEQSAVYMLQVGEQQGRFTTLAIDF
jgi:hypothetical protein